MSYGSLTGGQLEEQYMHLKKDYCNFDDRSENDWFHEEAMFLFCHRPSCRRRSLHRHSPSSSSPIKPTFQFSSPPYPSAMSSEKSSKGAAFRSIFLALLFILFLAGITALVLYLIYRPSKPHFTVLSATIYAVNSTSDDPASVSVRLQFTLAIQNPGERSRVMYDRLGVFVVYKNQAITEVSPLPPLDQDKDSTVLVSPDLGGTVVTVSPDVARGLAVDRDFGLVSVKLVVRGRLKYKAGVFRSPWYGLFVECDLIVGVKKGRSGQVPLLGSGYCSVHT